jgi:hypothetical protein
MADAKPSPLEGLAMARSIKNRRASGGSCRRLALIASLFLALSTSGCRRGSYVFDGTMDETDAGLDDAGLDARFTCDPDAGPPAGDLLWKPGVPASVTPSQSTGWVATSTDAECVGLKPSAVPAQLSWTEPTNSWCDPSSYVDGNGDLAFRAGAMFQPVTRFFRPDGSAGKAITDGTENHLWLAPRASGFWLLSVGGWRTRNCQFFHQLGPDGSPVQATWTEKLGLTPNPTGGFVQSRGTINYESSPPYMAEEVRWVSAALEPLGDWHVVFTWTVEPNPNIQLQMIVDRQGRALMLSFAYPKTFGPSSPPSEWKFSARWMGQDGALGDIFEPLAPTFILNDGYTWFAGWGTLLPLPGGGVAAFHDPREPAGGTTSPSGWYASYPGGESRTAAAPDWLQPYDGSIQMLAGGGAYVATRRDPNTCARTALLITPSGRTCYTLPLQGSNLCRLTDTIFPDGTLVLQDHCQVTWWPGLGRLSQ